MGFQHFNGFMESLSIITLFAFFPLWTLSICCILDLSHYELDHDRVS